MGTGKLQEHHIVFRSEGGERVDPSNITSLCNTHHGYLLHAGMIRCRGRAPDDLEWKLGVRRGLSPFLLYRGDVRVGGVASAERAWSAGSAVPARGAAPAG